VDIIRELLSYEINVSVYDPWAKAEDVMKEYNIPIISSIPAGKKYDSVVLAVAHNDFMGVNWRDHVKQTGIIYDVKGCLEKDMVNARL